MKKNLSGTTKEEVLSRHLGADCCKVAFLSAVIHSAGSLLIGGRGRLGIIIKSSAPMLKKRLDSYLKQLYNLSSISDEREIRLEGENTINILLDCGILKQSEELEIIAGIDEKLVQTECCASAYIGGIFVGCGSIYASQSGYHLEFVLERRSMADDLLSLLSGVGIMAKYTIRREKHVVYLKDNESIGDCLAFCNAGQAALEISGMFVDRQVSQQTNRRFNCDMANLDRIVSVGVRQAELFSSIVDRLEDDKLIKTAEVRIANPHASYEQLAEMLEVSKSGVKHRLKKLEDIAQEFSGGGSEK